MPDSDNSQPSKILIADDNEQNCELLEAYLAGEDYDIAMAFDGQETIDKVAEFHPDIILLDIMMPRMSGYEVCEQIRKKYLPSELPVIMVTAKNLVRDLVTGLPRTIVIGTEDIRDALEEPVAAICDAVKSTLDKTPPELAADIMERGITLAGGGALLGHC